MLVARPVSALPDRVLRRYVWVVPGFLVAMVGIQIGLRLTDGLEESGTWADAVAYLGIALSFPLTGALIVRRQPRNRVGWLLQAIGATWALALLTDNYVRYGLVVNPGSLPRPDVVAVVNAFVWVPSIGLMGTFLVLLYPDGHLPSRRWLPVAWLSAIAMGGLILTFVLTPGPFETDAAASLRNPFGWEAAQPVLAVLVAVFLMLLPLCVVASAAALVHRFRHSVGVERLQLKWLATAGAVVAGLFLLAMVVPRITAVVGSSGEGTASWLGALDELSFMSFALLPVAIGVAILRHGLYEIDVIINRALVYSVLTVALAGVYLGSVLLLQLVLSPVTQQSDLAVAGSTLAVAALFNPVRARIRRGVDRRFYRSRYDAARTLDDFVHHLRHELDLDAVGQDLRAAVDQTLHPAHVTLWCPPYSRAD
jgi:hypothetical protein